MNRITQGIAFLALGALMGCAQGVRLGSSSGVQADRDPFGAVVQGLAGALVPGRQAAPAGFTATRASLAAQGFDQPLLTAEVQDTAGTWRKAGLLQTATPSGTLVWQGGDGGGVTTRGGVVQGSAGLLQDAYGIEAAPTVAALAAGGASAYRKDYRHLTGLNQIRRTQMSCTLAAQGAEQITVLGRTHATTRYVETCTALTPDPLGARPRFENIYWKGRGNGVLWRSEQWISPKVGHIRLERVFL